MKEIVLKGVKMWDDTDQVYFLENMVNTTIIPKLPKAEPMKDNVDKNAIDAIFDGPTGSIDPTDEDAF